MHPDAIDCLLRGLQKDSSSPRELAVNGLKTMDLDKLNNPEFWAEKIINALQSAKEVETEDFLIEKYNKAIQIFSAY